MLRNPKVLLTALCDTPPRNLKTRLGLTTALVAAGAIALQLAGGVGSVWAEELIWDREPDPNTGAIVPDSGIWNQSADENWQRTNGSNQRTDFDSNDEAVFQAPGAVVAEDTYVITVGGTVLLTRMTIEQTGFTFVGGTLDSNQAGPLDPNYVDIVVNNNSNASMTSSLVGVFRLRGDGKLTYSGSSTDLQRLTVRTGAELTNNGSLSGDIIVEGTLNGTGNFTGNVDGTVSTSSVTIAGTVGGDVTILSGVADLTDANVIGDVDNSAVMTLQTEIGGDLTNNSTGRIDVAGTTSVDGDIVNAGTGGVSGTPGERGIFVAEDGVAGTLVELKANSVTNSGRILVDSTGTLKTETTDFYGVTNQDDGRITVNGAVESNVLNQTGGYINFNKSLIGTLVNQGGVEVLGTVSDDLINDPTGTMEFDGDLIVSGDIVNKRSSPTVAGELTVVGDVSGNPATVSANTVTNAGAFVIEPGHTVTATSATAPYGVINQSGGSLLVDGDAGGNATLNSDVQNQGGGSLTVDGRIIGTVQNQAFGTIDLNNILTGSVVNAGDGTVRGTISGDLTNNAAGILTVDGGLAVTGAIENNRLNSTTAAEMTVSGGNLTGATITNAGDLTVNSLRTLEATSVTAPYGVTNENDGKLTVDGTVKADVLNRSTGTLDLNGTVTGRLVNQGGGDIRGLISGDFDNRDTADLAVDGSLTVTGNVTNAGKLEVEATRKLTTGNLVQNNGTGKLTLNGELAANLNNVLNGQVTLGTNGKISGYFTNLGKADLGGAITGALGNGTTGTMTVANDLSASQLVTNDNELTVDALRNLTAAAGVQNNDLLTVNGTVTGVVTNAAGATVEMGSNGEIDGALTNSGIGNLSGKVTGALTNDATGTMTIKRDTIAESTVDNHNTMNVNTGRTLTADVSSGVVNKAGATLNINGTVDAKVGNTNTGIVNLNSDGKIIGTLSNFGTANVAGTVQGSTVNQGIGVINSNGGNFQGSVTNDGTFNILANTQIAGAFENNNVLNQLTGNNLSLDVSTTFTNNGTIDAGGTGSLSVTAETIELSNTSVVSGDVSFFGNISNNGIIIYDVDTTLSGSLTNTASGDVTVAAEVDADGAMITNQGQFAVTDVGDLKGVSMLTNSGTMTIASGGNVNAETTTNQSGGELTNSGRLNSDVLNETGGTLTSTGTIVGDVTNDAGATAVLSGTVGGNVNNDGSLAVTAGDLTVAALDNSGTLTLDAANRLEATNGITNADGGEIDAAGILAGDVINEQGGRLTSANRIVGTLTNGGVARVKGTVTGRVTNEAGGNLATTGDLTLPRLVNNGTATVRSGNALTGNVVNKTDGTLNIRGRVVGDVENAAGGDVTLTGRVKGTVTNAGALDAQGEIGDTLFNDGGNVSVTGDLAVTGNVNNQSGTLSVDGGNLTTRRLINAGTVTVAAAQSVATTVGITNKSTGTMTVDGRMTGDLTNTGTLTLKRGLDGSLINAGDATVGGRITGDLTQTDGSLTFARAANGDQIKTSGALIFARDLTVDGTFTTATDLDIASTRTITANRFVNGTAATLTLDGMLDAAATNNGTIQMGSGGEIKGNLRNAGTVVASGNMSLDGNLNNSGTIDLTGNRTVGDKLTVAGNASGNKGVYKLDLDLSRGDGVNQSDVVEVKGAAKGHVVLDFSLVPGTSQGRQTNSILVFDVNESLGSANDFTFEFSGLPPFSERIVYSAFQEADFGNVVVVDQINPGIGAVSGNVVLTQSLIGSVINRPSSPFVVGLAFEDQEKPCGTGGWARATGGTITATGTTTNGVSKLPSKIDASYAGVQVGTDIACFNGHFSGWDLAFGAIGGLNTGKTSQPVYAVDANNPTLLTGTLTSTTKADFSQTYGGIYVTGAKGPFAVDLQYRLEKTAFTLNNVAPVGTGFGGLGLTDAKFDTNAQTLSGSMSYVVPLKKEGWSFVPTAGFAYTKTKSDVIVFDDGSELQIDDSSSRIGFAGATVSRTKFGSSGNWAMNQFVTLTAYNDFAPATDSVYTVYDADGSINRQDNLSSDNLGAYQELSVGVNYIKVLNPGAAGAARQFNASVRADGRFGESLDSIGVTAQVRWQF